jgi:hypothetical protein
MSSLSSILGVQSAVLLRNGMDRQLVRESETRAVGIAEEM